MKQLDLPDTRIARRELDQYGFHLLEIDRLCQMGKEPGLSGLDYIFLHAIAADCDAGQSKFLMEFAHQIQTASVG